MKDTLNKNWKPTQKIVKSGDWIISEWKKWLYQKRGISDLNSNEIAIIDFIAEMSFRWGHRYCYLSYEELQLNKRTAIRTIKKLQEKKILHKETSYIEHGGSKIKAKNKYYLHIPKELQGKLKFYGKGKQESIEKIDIEDIKI